MTDRREEALEGQREGPVVRDRRRLDPQTGQVREPQPAAPGPDGRPAAADAMAEQEAAGNREAELEAGLAELTRDLQRLQAEYVNYKRRVDRDRELVRELAVGSTLSALLPVLDDIDRAREHGELEGGFKAVAESFERIVTGLGLVRYGEPGEAFDPRIHEALMHSYSEGVEGPTCEAVLQPGYRIGERILRPARVAVVEASEPAPEPEPPAEPEQAALPEPPEQPA